MVSKGKTTITFHSGILTIGGTIIEVSYAYFLRFWDRISPGIGAKR